MDLEEIAHAIIFCVLPNALLAEVSLANIDTRHSQPADSAIEHENPNKTTLGSGHWQRKHPDGETLPAATAAKG